MAKQVRPGIDGAMPHGNMKNLSGQFTLGFDVGQSSLEWFLLSAIRERQQNKRKKP